ncbi:MMPL family transporter [Rubrivirga sp. S365]|uniref:MMPL family transporter n=1 Tax=Rubrivirga litoralis TaxID=3075598 RepID=A0ABU3BLM1_9BACT|nr:MULTISPECIES: MMPL family transporter [unclassified Rubrivirga]MDT0630180.1 MMPL family transporter [Rubrivirga sp. F394]MDT7855691.1 MMPL family transporter [Rubrivirga sp. S365]
MNERLRIIPRWIVRHPLTVLVVAFAFVALGVSQAVKLRIDTNIATLLPPDFDSVQALNKLQQAVGAETTVDVAITSPDFEANLAFAEDFIPRMMELQGVSGDPYFSRYDFRRDVRFVTENALYFATFDELDRLEDFLRQTASQVRSTTDPLRMDLFGDEADAFQQQRQQEQDELRADLAQLALTEYTMSPDSTTLVVRFYPTGSKTDIGFVEQLYADVDELVIRMQPGRYHPEMVVTPAGQILKQAVEVRSITSDVQNSFGGGVLAVVLTVVLYFLYKSVQARTGGRLVWRVVAVELLRTPVTALLLTVPLLISLSWTAGVAGAAFGTLNLMTSTLGLVLFGLGIDYGIHFYARYAEERGAGRGVSDAVEETFVSTGQGIAVSAFTTAFALFVLQIADFRGFSEFGLIGGMGIVFALISMLFVLPALLSIAERVGALNLRSRGEASAYEPDVRFPFSRTVVSVCLGITALCVLAVPDVRFEYNFSNLEPEYPDYERRAQALTPALGQSERRNPAYILLDDPQDVRSVTAALKRLAERDSMILAVESLQERFPTDPETTRRKLDRLAEVREVLQDPFLAADTTGQIQRLREAASATTPIPLDSVPAFITRPFMTREGTVGNFVIVFPRGKLSDGRRSIRFGELIGQVTTPDGGEFFAASTQLVAADMLKLMQEESQLMVGVTFVLVFVLVFVSFRSLRWTLVAVTPLAVGLVWMLGAMVLLDVQLTFYNLVVLPTVLGIGNDGGVHLTHRYREEGRGSIRRVLRSTGEHVTMGALTNLIGFGGLLVSNHPGLRSIGVLAVVGIGTTLVATLAFFPALLQVAEDNRWLEPRPRRKRHDVGDPDALRHPVFKLHAPSESTK